MTNPRRNHPYRKYLVVFSQIHINKWRTLRYKNRNKIGKKLDNLDKSNESAKIPQIKQRNVAYT